MAGSVGSEREAGGKLIPLPTTPSLAAFEKLLLDNLPCGASFLDTELRYVWINETLAQLNGVPAEDHIGKRVAEALPEGIGERMELILQGVLTTGEPVRDFRVTFGTEGTGPAVAGPVTLVGTFLPVYDPDIVGLVTMVQIES